MLDAKFATGHIKSYNPELGTYTVSLTGVSEAPSARPINSGIRKPIPKNAKVACMQPPYGAWLILGEIDEIQPAKKVPTSPDDTITEKDMQARGLDKSKYSIDAAAFRNPKDEKQYEGDAVLQNRNEPRSFIKVYEKGDIYALATQFCFFLLSAVKEAFLLVANEASIIFSGFSIKTAVDTANKSMMAAVVVNGDLSQDQKTDFSARAGRVGTDEVGQGILASLGDHTKLLVDNEKREVKLSRMDDAGYERSVDVKKEEFDALWGDNEVHVNKDSLTVGRKTHKIAIDDNRLALQWDKNNYIVINERGIKIQGKLMIAGKEMLLTNTTKEEDDPAGIGEGDQMNVEYAIGEAGGPLKLTLKGNLNRLELDTDVTVREMALVNENFLPLYDADMGMLRSHTHPVNIETLTAEQSPGTITVDMPPTNAKKSSITSKRSSASTVVSGAPSQQLTA